MMTTTTTTEPKRKLIRLDGDAVENAILTAEGETQAVERVFRLVYPEFDRIKSVNGYPECNTVTWKLICNWFMALTDRLNRERAYDKQIMPGGAWLNWGFSAHGEGSKELRDWQVIPAEVTTT